MQSLCSITVPPFFRHSVSLICVTLKNARILALSVSTLRLFLIYKINFVIRFTLLEMDFKSSAI